MQIATLPAVKRTSGGPSAPPAPRMVLRGRSSGGWSSSEEPQAVLRALQQCDGIGKELWACRWQSHGHR